MPAWKGVFHYVVGETHAVVIGASIAGLLAASVLAESFSRVTVFDRDTLPQGPEPRQGVPQSRHAHALHARGAQALNDLLPGLRDEMVAAGAATGDFQGDTSFYLDGYLLARAESGLVGIGMTRRALERLVRDRAGQLPGVRITDSTAVDDLVVTDGRVTGVRVRPAGAQAGDGAGRDGAGTVAADLVVDAGGRGSRMPVWLRELGYPPPRVTEVRIDVVYVTRHYQHTPGELGGLFAALTAQYPGSLRGGAVIRQEAGQWVMVLSGMLGDHPPADEAGLLEFAQSLDAPEIAAVMRSARPLDSPVAMRFPSSVRRHYEKLGRFPGGLIVTGDALCSFNPIYGQGMTIAALEALALRRALAADGDVPARFFKAAGKLVNEAWTMSVGGDLRFPEVEGKRMPGSRIIQAYLARYRVAASVDPVLARTFIRVANMIDPPAKMFAPASMARVFRPARKATAKPADG